jgi:hypothetical protein
MQLPQPAEPFGEVNVRRRGDGRLDIVATILMVPDIEGSRTGLALDASASMKRWYGVSGVVGGLFAAAAVVPNVVEPVARTMAAYLARFSADGRCDCLYWACNPDGGGVEPIGRLDADAAKAAVFRGPARLPWGRGTKLLPPVRHFVETAFAGAPWSIAVLVTDGRIEDLDAVKDYTRRFAAEVAAGRRRFVKLVLVGVGEQVDEAQMSELDDMFEGSGLRDPQGREIDVWDHKLARDMRKLEEIFAEVVGEDTVVAPAGHVTDDRGRPAADWPDGLPALLRFTLPAGATAFRLHFPGGDVL